MFTNWSANSEAPHTANSTLNSRAESLIAQKEVEDETDESRGIAHYREKGRGVRGGGDTRSVTFGSAALVVERRRDADSR